MKQHQRALWVSQLLEQPHKQSVPGPADTSKIFNTKSHLSYLTLTMLHQGRNIHTHYVRMLTHRLRSVSEHKLHSDIKVWVAILDSPMATVSYGLTLAQVLICWKKNTVSASIQIYAENKYVLEETSAFCLLAGAVPYLLTNTQSPQQRGQNASFVSAGGRNVFSYHFAVHNKCNAVDRGHFTTSAISSP